MVEYNAVIGEEIEELAGFGMSEEDIAECLLISPSEFTALLEANEEAKDHLLSGRASNKKDIARARHEIIKGNKSGASKLIEYQEATRAAEAEDRVFSIEYVNPSDTGIILDDR